MAIQRLLVCGLLVSSLAVSVRAVQPVCVPGSLGFGDFHGEGDIALPDYAVALDCLFGPGSVPTPTHPVLEATCLSLFNSSADTDVDLVDLARFFRSYTGPCSGLGDCPTGSHLQHMSGEPGIVGQDTADINPPNPREYRCVPDESCHDLRCDIPSSCQLFSGKAGCACEAGYAGEFCESCAVGYERSRDGDCILGTECRERLCSGQGNCALRGDDLLCLCDPSATGDRCENGGGDPNTLRPPTWVVLRGTDRSLQLGESREICASLSGGGRIDTELDWRLVGPGTLFVQNQNQDCYNYTAPPPGSFRDSQVAEIQVCSRNFPDQCASRYLLIGLPGAIAASGHAHSVFKPIDDNIQRFMRYRCIGGAVLGISIFGKPVYVRGYGNLSGAPTNDPAYLAACGDTFDVSHEVDGYVLPDPSEVQPNSPFRIASNSKAVIAAVLRKVIKGLIFPVTDAGVEAFRLCDGIIPQPIRDVVCGATPPPQALFTASGVLPNCSSSNPCPYGGDCVVLDPLTGLGGCDNCPAGFGGLDCSWNLAFCPDLFQAADSRWADVTVGHLMGHRAGLPRSVPDRDAVILPNLFLHRDLTTQADWQAQEDALTADGDFPSGSFDAQFPGFSNAKNDIGDSAYFIPRPTTTEAVLARMGACLLSTPGAVTMYSNTGYAFLGIIAEFVSEKNFAGRTGKPHLHSGSLLEEFLQDDLGVPIPGQGTVEGMYVSQNKFSLRNTSEPVWRVWSTQNDGTYYKLVDDEKRPYCVWGANHCSFADWINGVLRFEWDFIDRPAIQAYEAKSFAGPATAGSLAVEAEVYLRFMAKYWVDGKGLDPRYGETRCPEGNCIWSLSTSHTGSAPGTFSDVKQLGGTVKTATICAQDSDCPNYIACAGTPEAETVQQFCLGGLCRTFNEFFAPPRDSGSGVITDNFAEAECRYCRLPVGVDIFVAFNQEDDKKCYEAGLLGSAHPDYYTCSNAYNAIGGFLGDAACKVPWPADPFQVWPPVTQEGGSTLSPQFAPQ